MDFPATHKRELVLDVGALPAGSFTLRAELLDEAGNPLLNQAPERRFTKEDREDAVVEFPADGVEILVHEPSAVRPGLPTLTWPLSTGVPFPKFAVDSPQTELGLFEVLPSGAEARVAAQFSVRSRWYMQRGGVRWVGLDFLARADAENGRVTRRAGSWIRAHTTPPSSPLALGRFP